MSLIISNTNRKILFPLCSKNYTPSVNFVRPPPKDKLFEMIEFFFYKLINKCKRKYDNSQSRADSATTWVNFLIPFLDSYSEAPHLFLGDDSYGTLSSIADFNFGWYEYGYALIVGRS